MNDSSSLPLAKKRIANLISKRFYSEHEIRTKLAKFSVEVTDEAIAWAKEQGFIDDIRFCRAFIHDTLLLNPQGKRLVFSKLRKKGIQGTLIEKVLQEEYPKELEEELAFRVAQK
ncbi:MAG: regulatory protein RecX, partial [Bacillota bacterium]